jgi:hypothetical protein
MSEGAWNASLRVLSPLWARFSPQISQAEKGNLEKRHNSGECDIKIDKHNKEQNV